MPSTTSGSCSLVAMSVSSFAPLAVEYSAIQIAFSSVAITDLVFLAFKSSTMKVRIDIKVSNRSCKLPHCTVCWTAARLSFDEISRNACPRLPITIHTEVKSRMKLYYSWTPHESKWSFCISLLMIQKSELVALCHQHQHQCPFHVSPLWPSNTQQFE